MELGTMSHRSSVLTESLDCALESLTFGNSSCIDLVACCEDVSLDLLCQCILLSVFKLELSDISLAGYASLLEVSLLSLVNAVSVDYIFLPACSVNNLFFLVNEANLYCLVSVVLYGLNLCYYTGTSLKYGYGNQHAIFIEDLSHSDFGC